MTPKHRYRIAALFAAILALGLFTAVTAVAQPGQDPGQGQGQGPGQPEAIDTGENYSVDFRGCGQVRFLPDDPEFNGTIDTNASVLDTNTNNTTTFNISFTSDDLDNQDRLKFSNDHAAALINQNVTSVNASDLDTLLNQTNETNLTNTTNMTNTTNITNATNATNETNVTVVSAEDLKIIDAAGIANPNQCATVLNNGTDTDNETDDDNGLLPDVNDVA